MEFIKTTAKLVAQDGSGSELEIDSYKVAPGSQQAMDDTINDALAKAGLPSLDELRG